MKVVDHFKIPYGVIINKCDINLEMTEQIEKWAKDKLIGKLPFDRAVFMSISNLVPIMDSKPEITAELEPVFEKVCSKLNL